jgi:ethanolamine utilization protein EutA
MPRTIEAKLPIVLLADQTIARALGKALKENLSIASAVISLEGVSVAEYDFIDVAAVVQPANVIPVSIKSLLFAGGLDRRSVKQALIAAAKSQA